MYQDSNMLASIRKVEAAREENVKLDPRRMTAEEKDFCEQTETRVEGVHCSEVQWPVWLTFASMNTDTERMVQYYRRANHSQESGETTGTLTT